MKIADPQDWLNVHFDSDPEYGPGRIRLWEEIRLRDEVAKPFLNAITFASPKSVLPLQAADLLAWETRKSLIQKAGGFDSTPRYRELFTALAGYQLDYDSELWTKKEIEENALPLVTGGQNNGETRKPNPHSGAGERES